MLLRALLLLLILVVTSPGWISGPTVTVNFDVGARGETLRDGDVVNEAYAAYGLHFARVGRAGGCGADDLVFANDDRGGQTFASPPNVVSICGANEFSSFNAGRATVRVTSDRPLLEACVFVAPSGDDDTGVLQILDDSGDVTASVTSDPGEAQTLCIQGQEFDTFEFAGYDRGFARFDDVRVTFAPRHVDFDTAPDGAPVASGADVGTIYAPLGVVFEQDGGRSSLCGTEIVHANSDQGAGAEPVGSAPNVVSPCPEGVFSDFNDYGTGLVRASFRHDISAACIDVFPTTSSDEALLAAYDASGDELDQATSPAGASGQLCVSGNGIRSIEFAGTDNGYARFDDLEFDFGEAALDFDTNDAGEPLADGDLVNEAYVDFGVMLERDGAGDAICGAPGAVYARDDAPSEFAGTSNVVSICNTRFSDFSEDREGLVHAVFPFDALQVCVYAWPTRSTDAAVLRAYDANDALVDETTSPTGVDGTICVSGAGIRGVRFAGYEGSYARFDDLDVTFAPPPGMPEPGGSAAAQVVFVPEPATLLLAACALLALAVLRRVRRAS